MERGATPERRPRIALRSIRATKQGGRKALALTGARASAVPGRVRPIPATNFRSLVTIPRGWCLQFAGSGWCGWANSSDGGFFALLEDSYFSRFFAKFVEIIAISFATACSAYLVAHFVGPPPARGPTPAAISVGAATPSAVETQKSPAAEPAPAVAATAGIEEPRPATRPVTDAAAPTPKAAKSATSAPQAPAQKDVRATASVPHSEKSAEALARAALANLDADRAAPPDAPVRRVPAGPGPVASAPVVDVAPRPIDPPPRAADMPPPPSAVEVPPRPVATVDPPELAAPRAESPVEEPRGLFALPKRMLGLLRAGTSSLADDGPRRPPLPVGDERPD
jgi:hypothetical protein